MNQAQNDARLSLLPVIGTDIRVHSQDKLRTFPCGRISCDGETVVIDVIKKSREQREFPAISKIVTMELNEIVKISFRNLDGQRVSLLGDSNYWLNGLPRSGKSSVLVLCQEKDRTIDISCGWVEYTRNKVIVREIVRATEQGCEIDTHERFISQVALVLVSDDEETKLCMRVTATK